MLLSDVDRRARMGSETAQREHENCDNENETCHRPAKVLSRPPSSTVHPLVVKGLRQPNRSAKVTRLSVFPASGRREQLHLAAGCETVRLC